MEINPTSTQNGDQIGAASGLQSECRGYRDREFVSKKVGPIRGSLLVVLGFLLWIGFFLGALVMHAAYK